MLQTTCRPLDVRSWTARLRRTRTVDRRHRHNVQPGLSSQTWLPRIDLISNTSVLGFFFFLFCFSNHWLQEYFWRSAVMDALDHGGNSPGLCRVSCLPHKTWLNDRTRRISVNVKRRNKIFFFFFLFCAWTNLPCVVYSDVAKICQGRRNCWGSGGGGWGVGVREVLILF